VNVAFSLEVLQFTVKLFESPEHALPQRVEAAGIQRLQKTVTGATMELRSENERDVQLLSGGQRRLSGIRLPSRDLFLRQYARNP
jgi:hypothetical protein